MNSQDLTTQNTQDVHEEPEMTEEQIKQLVEAINEAFMIIG